MSEVEKISDSQLSETNDKEIILNQQKLNFKELENEEKRITISAKEIELNSNYSREFLASEANDREAQRKLSFAEIRNAILKNFENHQLSNSTKSKYLGYISSVFNYGIDNHYLEHNPINKSIIPKAVHKEVISFSPEEVEAILKMLMQLNKEITYGVVLFSRYFGTRISETLSLKWSNINHEDIKFIRKGGKTARLPYDKFDRIISWINSQPRSNDKLFNITSQKAGLHLKQAINSINADPNINMIINDTLSFHAIRKMRENELIKLFKNEPKVVADFMGHTLAIQQKHYLTVFEADELREKLKFE